MRKRQHEHQKLHGRTDRHSFGTFHPTRLLKRLLGQLGGGKVDDLPLAVEQAIDLPKGTVLTAAGEGNRSENISRYM